MNDVCTESHDSCEHSMPSASLQRGPVFKLWYLLTLDYIVLSRLDTPCIVTMHLTHAVNVVPAVQSVLGACFQADVQLQSVYIRSRNCFRHLHYAPLDGFLQLAHLQEVALPEAGLLILPDGPWLHQLKVLDVSQNTFRRIPPVLLKYKATLRKLNLMRAVGKRSAPLRNQRITRSMSKDESLRSNLIQIEVEGADRGEEAFSAAKCRADYQELVDAGIDVQINKDALLDSYVQ